MLAGADMQTFRLACEVLKERKTREAYELLKQHTDSPDKYKRRCILEAIFVYDEADELSAHLADALAAEEHFLVTTALSQIIAHNVSLPGEEILTCFERNYGWLDGCYYQALSRLEKSEANLDRVISLWKVAPTNSARIALAECMEGFAAETNYVSLFERLADHSEPKIRMSACRIAKQFERYDWLARCEDDPDGHIRKFVKG